jgi:sialate O-acetylesterase
LRGFAVAGADRKWVTANATVQGDRVVVSSPEIPEPEAVRYAWTNYPDGNLTNASGLPASPFRTDSW